MTSIEAAIKAILDTATVASGGVFIAGGRDATDYPHVTIARIATAGAAHLDGPATLEWPLVQIDCWAQTALAALDTGEAVRASIDGIGAIGAGKAIYASLQDQRGPAPDEDTRTFRVSQDYLVFHERT